MKKAQLSLAALLIAGPMCLAACGDDSEMPTERDTTDPVAPGGQKIPPDLSEPQQTMSGSASVDSSGATQAPTTVKTPGNINGSHSELSVPPGVVLRDANNVPVSAGDVSVQLTSFNSNRNSGIQQFRDKRASVGAARVASFDSFAYPVGAMEIYMTAGTQVVTQVTGGNSMIKYCSPSLSVFQSVTAFQQRLDGSWEALAKRVPVINNCVSAAMPPKLHCRVGVAAGILFNGDTVTGAAG